MFSLINANLKNQFKFNNFKKFTTINDTLIKNIICDLNECKNDEQTLKYYIKYKYFNVITNNIYTNKDLHNFIFDKQNIKVYDLYKEVYQNNIYKNKESKILF